MKIKVSLFIILCLTSSMFSFEVNTHQAITRCAITKECKQAGAVNLHNFAKDALLEKEDYKIVEFDQYNDTYFNYAETNSNFIDWKIKFLKYDYESLIEAGVVLEDSNYPDADPIAAGGDGRYNNHFYSAQFDSKDECTVSYNMLSNHALCAGYGKRTDNIDWALNDNVRLGTDKINGVKVVRKNDYNLNHAFEYYRRSFIGSEKDRKENQAKLFVSIGFLIHLIQDLHSPAHVRDGSHPGGDYLEIYGRYNGGFNLRDGEFNRNNNPLIRQAIENINMKKLMLRDNQYSSYKDFYLHEANWVSNNFMSEAHGIDITEKFSHIDSATGEGLELSEDEFGEKHTTIFDKYNTHLAKDEVTQEEIPNASSTANAENVLVFGKWYYLNTNGNVASEKGDINNHQKVALRYTGHLLNYFVKKTYESMAMVTEKNKSSKSYANYNKEALSDTAINVMPRAVVSSEAFINYFFRGRMKAVVDGDSLTIENISDPQWVSSADLCTFNAGMSIDIYYINNKNVSKELYSTTLANDVATGESITLDGLKSNLLGVNDWGEKKQIIVLLDGQLGEARGLVATYATIKSFPTNGGGNDNGGNTDNNNTTDPTKDPTKVCASNYFKYYNDGTLHETLQKGNKDVGVSDGAMYQVKELQEFLSAFSNNKYYVGKNGADGWFGSDTESALINFQSDYGINATGITDDDTKKGINGKCFNK